MVFNELSTEGSHIMMKKMKRGIKLKTERHRQKPEHRSPANTLGTKYCSDTAITV